MSHNLILTNFLSPPILFFFLGMSATFLRVGLTIPNPLPKFLSIYLLLVIGFQGGSELAHIGITLSTFITLIIAVTSSFLVPLYSYFVLRKKLNIYDAAATAATYGSVSAITFITAMNLLQLLKISFGGHMIAALALMEAPAIIAGLYLIRRDVGSKDAIESDHSFFREGFLNNSVFLILGSFIIGMLSGQSGAAAMRPFTHEIFKGMLSLFMLDMGVLAAKRISDLKESVLFLVSFGIFAPIFNAIIAVVIAFLLDFSVGNSLLLTVLFASASYIAVPAAMRLAVPQANPGIYIPMALGITFPFNILVGLPLYLSVIKYLLR